MRTACGSPRPGSRSCRQHVDTLIVIPNQNLFRLANERTTFTEAFKMADEVLHMGVRGVTDLMIMPGLINLDFADIRTVMSEMGKAMMGTGEAEGERRALEAAEAAISNPLLDEVSMKGARAVLINITGGLDMTLFEVDAAANRIREEVDPNANIIFGSTFNETMQGQMRVSVVATGIASEAERKRAAAAAATAPEPAPVVERTPAGNPLPVFRFQPQAGRPAPVANPAPVTPRPSRAPAEPAPAPVRRGSGAGSRAPERPPGLRPGARRCRRPDHGRAARRQVAQPVRQVPRPGLLAHRHERAAAPWTADRHHRAARAGDGGHRAGRDRRDPDLPAQGARARLKLDSRLRLRL